MTRTSLSEALRETRAATAVLSAATDDIVVQKLLKAFRESPNLGGMDLDALDKEVNAIASDDRTVIKAFELEGTEGIVEANECRQHIQSARDRLVTVVKRLRQTLIRADRVWKTAYVYIRTKEPYNALPAKVAEEVVSVALEDVRDFTARADGHLTVAREALANLESKTRSLDAWFDLHKQYAFLTLARRDR